MTQLTLFECTLQKRTQLSEYLYIYGLMYKKWNLMLGRAGLSQKSQTFFSDLWPQNETSFDYRMILVYVKKNEATSVSWKSILMPFWHSALDMLEK